MIPSHLPIIELQASRRLAVILGGAHLGAGLLLWMLPLPWWLQAMCVAVLMLSAASTLYRHAWRRGRDAVTALHCSDREQLQIRMKDGSWQTGRVLGSSTVGPVLTLLNIAVRGRRLPLHVVLLGDSLDADDFRRLRVWLRWGPRPPTEEVLTP